MRKKLSLASLACLPLFACGGDSGTKTVKVVDAKVFLDGSAAVACKAGSAYTAPGTTQTATDHPGMSTGSAHLHNQFYRGDINADIFVIFANAGDGPWTGTDLAPANVDLAQLTVLNPQLQLIPKPQFGSDGILTDDSFYNGSYLGFAGTVNFTSIGGPGAAGSAGTLFAGTFTNVELDHTLISTTGALSDPMDGCTTILSGSFSAHLTAGSAAFQGGEDDAGLSKFPRPVLTNRRF